MRDRIFVGCCTKFADGYSCTSSIVYLCSKARVFRIQHHVPQFSGLSFIRRGRFPMARTAPKFVSRDQPSLTCLPSHEDLCPIAMLSLGSRVKFRVRICFSGGVLRTSDVDVACAARQRGASEPPKRAQFQKHYSTRCSCRCNNCCKASLHQEPAR